MKGEGTFGSHRDSGYPRSRSAHDSGRSTGWGDSRESSTKGHASPEPAPKGWSASPWSNSGWGGASPAPGSWGNASPAHVGWGGSASPAVGGWGDSGAVATGWGKSANPAGGGWGGSEPSSRRTSAQFENKSPAKLPPSSPRGGRTASPTRLPPTGPPKDRDRERGREPDRDRESRRGNGSPSRQHRPRQSPEKTSSPSMTSRDKDRERDHSPNRRRESFGAGKLVGTTDAMDIDPPQLPPGAPASKHVGEPRATIQTPTSTTSSMPPPPLPLGAAAQPLGAAAAPLGKAPPPPSSRPPSLPPPPPPALTPTPATTTIQPPPIPLTVPIIQPPPVPRASVQQPQSPVSSVKDAPSVAQAQEWVRCVEDCSVDLWLSPGHFVATPAQVRAPQTKNQESGGSGKTPKRSEGDPSTMLASTRAEINQLQQSVQTLLERFAVSMKVMQVATASSTPGTGKSTLPVTPSIPALPGGSESLSQILSLENSVSKMQSELKLVEAEVVAVASNSRESARSKEEIQSVKEGIRKEAEDRAKEVGEIRQGAAAARAEVRTMKLDLEGMKMDVTNAYRGLGEAKQEVGKVKTQQDMLRAAVERVEQELGDVQKGQVDTSVEAERQFNELKQQVGQLKATMEELRLEIEHLKKGGEERAKRRKREREVPAPTSDAMDVDETRPIKRVRLSVASVAPEDEEPLPPALTQDISGPPNERLKELIDQIQDYMGMLENEMVQHHTDTRERLEEFAERIGPEPVVHFGQPDAEHAASTSGAERAESAPPAASSSRPALASGMRSSAPPDVSSERKAITRPTLATVEEGKRAAPHEVDTIATVRRDLDNVMEQLLGLWAAKGLWPEIIGKNLAAGSEAGSLEQVWEKIARATKTGAGVNGMKQVNGTGTHKGQVEDGPSDVIALVKSMQAEQAKMAQRVAEMEAKSRRAEAEKEAMRTQLVGQEKELKELRSILDDAFKPGNSLNEILDHAARTETTPLQREIAGIKRFAAILPSLLQLVETSAMS
ncbi:hypothetical protein FRC10_001067 [Ceratobasidium sp. 414]|nr:hypothetical protein FRC10_001067 [Ceratobasidium sp. 414]